MKKAILAFCALLMFAAPAGAGRRFNRSGWQIPQYIQTHTAPYSKRVAVVFPYDMLKNGSSDATNAILLKAFNTHMGALFQELRERGAEVHFYDTQTLMDSTSSIADAAAEQGQPIWNTFGDHYPVTLMVGFRSQFDGTLSDRRPWYKAYSTNTQMIHVVFNLSNALNDNSGTGATANCGTGASNTSFGVPTSNARMCTYYGERDTMYGNSVAYVTRAPDSVLNTTVYSVVRLFKPISGQFTHTTGKMPTGDDSTALSNELLPMAYRVYWKVPGASEIGRHVDYVLMGSTADDERLCYQHIVAALIMKYTTIQPIPVGWIDADDNGNFGYSKLINGSESTLHTFWPTNALLDSMMARGTAKWGVVWNMNGPADSLAYYRDNYGYSYLNRARFMTMHAHDTVSTHVYGNIYGKGSGNSDTAHSAVHNPRTAFVYSGYSNRTTDAATGQLGIYWRLRDHQTNMRQLFRSAITGEYLNTPNADGLPVGIRTSLYAGHRNTDGSGECPPDSFYMALAYGGIHYVATGFEFDYQPDTSSSTTQGYMHNCARNVDAGPKKYFAFGDESWTSPAGFDPEGRYHVAGEDRAVTQMQWHSVSEVTPQASTAREDYSTASACTMLGLRRKTYFRPQIRYNIGETSLTAIGSTPTLTRSRNMDFSRVRVTGLHPRQFGLSTAGSNNTYGDWHALTVVLNQFAVMNQLAGRSAFRFCEPWMTKQGVN